MQLYTIGHSNHSLDVLIDWLRAFDVSHLVDIRRHPGSRRLPQFNQEILQRGLVTAGIHYSWQGDALGGMRESVTDYNGFEALPAGAFRAFAMHMNTPGFRTALNECITLAGEQPTAIMCAERDPTHCHRQLISDYLVLNGYEVIHITGNGASELHAPNSAAQLAGESILYDRGTQPELGL